MLYPSNVMSTQPQQDTELARHQDPITKEWWRILRLDKKRQCRLESISERSLERDLTWAYACTITVERNEYVDSARVRAEMEAYLAMVPRWV